MTEDRPAIGEERQRQQQYQRELVPAALAADDAVEHIAGLVGHPLV